MADFVLQWFGWIVAMETFRPVIKPISWLKYTGYLANAWTVLVEWSFWHFKINLLVKLIKSMLACRLLLLFLVTKSCSNSFAIPRTVAHQAPPSMRFPRQEYWSGLSPFSRGSSRLRDRTLVSCISRWILYHWATREGLIFYSVSEIRTVLRKLGQVPTPQRTCLSLLSRWDSQPPETEQWHLPWTQDAPELDPSSAT